VKNTFFLRGVTVKNFGFRLLVWKFQKENAQSVVTLALHLTNITYTEEKTQMKQSFCAQIVTENIT